jgi:hypothetical protein
MPVVADFTEVIRNEPYDVDLGDDSQTPLWSGHFGTGGRHASNSPGGMAFIIFEVRGLSSGEVMVEINDHAVGAIAPGDNSERPYTQMIAFPGHVLNKNSSNKVELFAKDWSVGGGDQYDDYSVSNMICFFHQHA